MTIQNRTGCTFVVKEVVIIPGKEWYFTSNVIEAFSGFGKVTILRGEDNTWKFEVDGNFTVNPSNEKDAEGLLIIEIAEGKSTK